MTARNAATYGIGWSLKQVTVHDLDPSRSIAHCLDTEGTYVDVTTLIHRTGIRPAVGQIWLIDREFSQWSFAAFVDRGGASITPALTGDWQPLTFSHGWAPSSTVGDPAPQARATADGWVETAGVVSGGTVAAVGTLLTIGQLPAGLPVTYRGSAVVASQLPTTAGYVRASILPSGEVGIQVSVAYTPAWIDLTGLKALINVGT